MSTPVCFCSSQTWVYSFWPSFVDLSSMIRKRSPKGREERALETSGGGAYKVNHSTILTVSGRSASKLPGALHPHLRATQMNIYTNEILIWSAEEYRTITMKVHSAPCASGKDFLSIESILTRSGIRRMQSEYPYCESDKCLCNERATYKHGGLNKGPMGMRSHPYTTKVTYTSLSWKFKHLSSYFFPLLCKS